MIFFRAFSEYLIYLSLLCAGPLVIWPTYGVSEPTIIKNFILFFLLLSAWDLLRVTIRQRFKQTDDSKANTRLLNTVIFLVIVLLILAFMQSVRLRANNLLFYAILFNLSLSGIADSLLKRKVLYGALIFRFLTYFSTAYLSIVVILNNWSWPPLFLALGLGSNAFCYHVAKRESETTSTAELLTPWPVYSKLLIFLVLFGPFSIALLCYMQRLPELYLLILLVLLLAFPTLSTLNRADSDDKLPSNWLFQIRRVCLSFIFILLVCGYLSSYV